MVRTFEYAILTAIPNPRRGERVNVGVVIFREDRIDVRYRQAAYKLRALTGESWESRLESAATCLSNLFQPGVRAENVLSDYRLLEPLISLSGLGWLRTSDEVDYEAKVEEILKALVSLPRSERFERRTRINTEIASVLRKARVLAAAGETIDDHKIVRDFSIDDREGLTADFALKNGKLHVASTLDLRKQTAGLGDAALKSIVLDKARKMYHNDVKTIGVYAVDVDMADNFRSHIDLLRDYAEEVYDWQDRESRIRFQHRLYDALGSIEGHFI